MSSGSWPISNLVEDFVEILAPSSEFIVIYIIIWIVLLIGFSLLPPIWDAAMVSYIDSEHKSGTISFGSWVSKFFPMFEFNATTSLFNIVTWGIALSRMYVMEIFNWITITLMIMWLIFIFFAMLLLPYTKMLITLEDYSYFDAMKESASRTLSNFGITFKFMMINLFLYVRFLLNILIVVGIPLWLIYFASRMDLADSNRFSTSVVIVILFLIFLMAYVNGIIEAFFLTYWWKVYKYIWGEEELHEWEIKK